MRNKDKDKKEELEKIVENPIVENKKNDKMSSEETTGDIFELKSQNTTFKQTTTPKQPTMKESWGK